MATIIVNTTLDENDGSITDGDVSLRDALAAANDGDTITFASGAGEAFENGGTIRLSQALGELVIASDVTIDGDLDDDGAPDVTITGDTLGDDETTTDPLGNTVTDVINNEENGADNVRVFNVIGGSSTIDGLVITGGLTDETSGVGDGAGISAKEDVALSLTNTSVSGNSAGNIKGGGIGNDIRGGGISNDGVLTLTDTVLAGNRSYFGAGIENGGIATLTRTSLSGNHAQEKGGALYNKGNATLIKTTVSSRAIG